MSFRKFLDYFKKILLSAWSARIIRISLGLIFIYAGISKLFSLKAFAHTISEYNLVPEGLLAPVAIGLPVVEFLAGLGLIFAIRGSLSAIFGLLIMFVFVLWYGILKNLDIDCGCFTPGELKSHTSLWHAFYRDLLMIAAVLYLYWSRWAQSHGKTYNGLWAKINLNKWRSYEDA